MGGCKCSYRNCTAKSNGQIHLFHYPVFDRPRCNRWLINAHKQEFFDLKVSQLRNRVVCQYHFKDDDFMNSVENKLKPTAVPTLNGPYCDPSEWGGGEGEETVNQIDLEDIENDLYLNYEKKDCVSRKYGNFLSDSDLVDLDFLNYKKPSEPKKENVIAIIRNPVTETKKQETGKRQLNFEELTRTPKKHQAYYSPKSVRISKIEIISDEKVTDALKSVTSLEPIKHDSLLPLPKRVRNTRQNNSEIENSSQNLIKQEIGTNMSTFSSDTNLVCQNITKNISLPLTDIQPQCFEIPVITPADLPVLDLGITEPLNVNQAQTFEGAKIVDSMEVEDNKSNQIINLNQLQNPDEGKFIKENRVQLQDKKDKLKKPIPKTPEKALVSILKNKMCSKRLSAIQQKRDFNKKLTDIISSQILSEKEKQFNVEEKPMDSENLSTAELATSKMNANEKIVKSHLAEDSSLLCKNDYSVATLELRMKKMEQMLLQKMEDNTKLVLNLKKSIENKPSSFKTVTTQTGIDEETHKKYLYHEICKYLSPAANNFIFEELFINKFEPKLKLRR